jgi:hypothetical protein
VNDDDDDDSSAETPVNQVAAKPSEIRKRKQVIVIMDDDTSSLETLQPPCIEIEDSSLGSMSWDGGSLSFLDGLKDSDMPPDFEDDDISAILVEAGSEASAVVSAPQGSIDADGLFGRAFEQREIRRNLQVDSFIDFQQHGRATSMPPTPVNDLSRNSSRLLLDRQTRMVSLDDELSCIDVHPNSEAFADVEALEEEFDLESLFLSFPFDGDIVVPWDNDNEKQSTMLQNAEAISTNDHDFSMASF